MISRLKQLFFRLYVRWGEASPAKRRYIKIGFAIALILLWVARRNMGGGINLQLAEIQFLPTYSDQALCITRPKALAQTYLSVQFGGRLERVLFSPGDRVKTGDIIAVVDQTANAAGLKSALSGFRLAQSDYDRVSSLFSSGSVTREELDSTRSRLDVKRAELEQAKQRVEDSMVRSPMDGVVSVIVFKMGDKVPDGGRIAAVEDPNGVLALCRMSRDKADQLETPAEIASTPDTPAAGSQPAEAVEGSSGAEEGGETAPSTIVPVTMPRPMERSSSWQLVEETPPVTLNVPVRTVVEKTSGGFQGLEVDIRVETSSPEAKIAIGKLTEIRLTLPEKKNVVKMPTMAVVRRGGAAYVLVAEGRWKYKWNQISIITQTPQETIASGVPEGSGIYLLKDDLSKIEAYVSKRLAK